MLDLVSPQPVQPEDRVPKEHLRAALHVRDIKQTTLADRLELTPLTVNRWLHGRAALSKSRWKAVLFALGLPPSWVPGDEAPPLPDGWQPGDPVPAAKPRREESR
jgi:transcriptional regulator with XRE-family HTH domain